MLRRGARAVAYGCTGLGCAAAGFVAWDPGLRREAEFWYFAGPVAARYLAVQYTHSEEAAPGRYEDLHRLYAPRALEAILALRGLFIKFGQTCSARPELVPEPYRLAFEQLQSEVPAVDLGAIHQTIERELGPVDGLFSSLEPTPCGAASIGQVHRAVALDGRQLVVKVQYPGIREVFEADLRSILTLVWLARPNSVPSFTEFARQIRQELDYRREGEQLAEVYRAVMPKYGRQVAVPEIVPAYCSESVLAMSFLPGRSISQVAGGLQAAGVDLPKNRAAIREWVAQESPEPPKLSHWQLRLLQWVGPDRALSLWRSVQRLHLAALRVAVSLMGSVLRPADWSWLSSAQRTISQADAASAARAMVETLVKVVGHQMFSNHGLFQADPHPGNILVLPDGRLGLIDYGQCKRLSAASRRKLARLVLSVAEPTASDEEVAGAFRDLGLVTKNDDDAFIASFARLIFGKVTAQTLDRGWHKQLHQRDSVQTFPPDLIMVTRTVGLLRGVGLMLKCNPGVAEVWRSSATSALHDLT